MPKKSCNITEAKLRELYVHKKKSTAEVASILGIGRTTAFKYIKRYGLNRSRDEARSLALELGKGCLNIPRERLEQLYMIEKKSAAAIGRELGVSFWTIRRYLQKYNLVRSRSDIATEASKPLRLYDYSQVAKLYVDDRLIPSKISKLTGIPKPMIEKYLRRKGLLRSRLEGVARGSQHPAFRGKVFYGGYVYIYMPQHPKANKKGRVPEHILVWEEANGRPLPEGFIIHHLNGVKSDNRPENLMAIPRGKHHSYLVMQALQSRIRQLEERKNRN